ncbi:MAG: hypothetical protein IJ760_08245 [Bacteroidales bacterium]|nr:hypothetical protein [Bacteroidales bacterium]
MKKTVVAVGLMALGMTFTGCNQQKKELESRQFAIDSLQRIVDYKDAEIDSLFVMLNEIEDNLSMISSKYSTVQQMRRQTTEGSVNQRKQIAEQLSSIEQMMADNKQKIAQLGQRVSSLTGKNTDLEGYITRLEERAAQQEQQIANLMAELQNSKDIIESLNRDVTSLSESNQAKDNVIAQQIAEANRAWFIVGSYDELREGGIVQKSGGFIGIGRKQGTVADMNTELFTEIDRSKVTTISIARKKAVVISQHPEGSYELVFDEEQPAVIAYLRILNQAQFWKYTDYLVISTK